MRIDQKLFELGLAKSRTHAANLIQLGRVYLNEKLVEKPSTAVTESDCLKVVEEQSFYSLGGVKLQAAIDFFKINIKGKKVADFGCSNGGFTGVLLSEGAAEVFAVDVGENVLPDILKQDPRVTFLKKNVRFLNEADLPFRPDIITADLSFISLTQVLPIIKSLLTDGGGVIALIKPQFEAGKSALNKSGIVTEPKHRAKAITAVCDSARSLGFTIVGVAEAPHPFKDKNQEYLIYATV